MLVRVIKWLALPDPVPLDQPTSNVPSVPAASAVR
jgi:hypothetical protein